MSLPEMLVLLILVAGCGRGSPRGTIRASLVVSGLPADVGSVDFKVTDGSDTCEGPALANAVVLVTMDARSASAGTTAVFSLRPGMYLVCATPLTADGSPSDGFGSANAPATVSGGATVDVNLVLGCSGADCRDAGSTAPTDGGAQIPADGGTDLAADGGTNVTMDGGTDAVTDDATDGTTDDAANSATDGATDDATDGLTDDGSDATTDDGTAAAP